MTWIISLVCQPFIVYSISSNRYENELNEGYVYIACDLDYKFSLSTVYSLYCNCYENELKEGYVYKSLQACKCLKF